MWYFYLFLWTILTILLLDAYTLACQVQFATSLVILCDSMPENGIPEKVQFSGTPFSGIVSSKMFKFVAKWA